MKTASPDPKPLNVRQQKFCENVACGMSATEAYLKAGYKATPKAAGTAGPRLLENVAITAHIAALRVPITRKALLTKDRKRELLRDIAESEKEKAVDRIRAMEADARLAGHFEPDRVEVDVGEKTLLSIKERASQVTSALAGKYAGGKKK